MSREVKLDAQERIQTQNGIVEVIWLVPQERCQSVDVVRLGRKLIPQKRIQQRIAEEMVAAPVSQIQEETF